MNRLVQATPAVAPRTAEDPRRIGGYRVLGRLGVGGMGTVFLAADHTGRQVAVKVVAPSWAANPSYRARFSREVRALKRVSGADAVRVVEFDTQTTPQWVAMEYVPGPTLFSQVAAEGPLAPDEVASLALAMLRSLEALHRAGIIHRDLKPGNVILSPDGPRIIDFGVATLTHDAEVTTVGERPGSLAWMTPEQLTDGRITTANDLHAWAQVVCYAASGQGAFGTGTPEQIAQRIRQGQPDLDLIDGQLDWLQQPLRRALQRDPEDRPSTLGLANIVERSARRAGAPTSDTTATPSAPEPPERAAPEDRRPRVTIPAPMGTRVAPSNTPASSPPREPSASRGSRRLSGLRSPHVPVALRQAPAKMRAASRRASSRLRVEGDQLRRRARTRLEPKAAAATSTARRGMQLGLILLLVAGLILAGKLTLSYFSGASPGRSGATPTTAAAESTLGRLYGAWSDRDDATVAAMVSSGELPKFRSTFLDGANIARVENFATTATGAGARDFCSKQRFIRDDGKVQVERRCFSLVGDPDNLTVDRSYGQQTVSTWS